MRFVDGICSLELKLSMKDLAGPTQPEALRIVAPRSMYLPAYFNIIRQHYGEFISGAFSTPDREVSISFHRCSDEYQIPWHFPLGMRVCFSISHS